MTSDLLADNVLFISVNVSRWRGQYEVAQAVVQVGEETVEKGVVTRPRWKLIPKRWETRFSRIEVSARAAVNRWALPFPIPGISVIPRLQAEHVFEELDKVETEMKTALEEFIKEMPDIEKALRIDVPPNQWPEVCKLIPSEKVLRSKFSIQRRIVPVGGLNKTVDNVDASAYAKEIGKRTAAFLDETAQAMADGIRAELADAINAVIERMANKGVMRDSTLTCLDDALSKLQAFKFLAGPDLLEKVNSARKTLQDWNFAELNKEVKFGDGAVVTQLTDILKGVTSELANDAKLASMAGKSKRSIL